MITLSGILRQSGASEYDGKKKTKLWVEHTSSRDNGPDDLKLEELFMDGDLTPSLPQAGQQISVVVRPYAVGKGVKFAAVGLAGKTAPALPGSSKP
jgi:hypothetical protein